MLYPKKFVLLIPIIITIPFLIINFNNSLCSDLFKTFGYSLGFLISMIIEEKYIKLDFNVPFSKKLIRLVVAALLGIIIYLTKIILPAHNFFAFLRYFFVTLSAFLLAPLIMKKIENRKKKQDE